MSYCHTLALRPTNRPGCFRRQVQCSPRGSEDSNRIRKSMGKKESTQVNLFFVRVSF